MRRPRRTEPAPVLRAQADENRSPSTKNTGQTVLSFFVPRRTKTGLPSTKNGGPPVSGDVDVVVIGGGISGLVAAYRLVRAGRDVTLIEPDTLGGKIRTSLFAGRPLDEGADAFLLRVPWALDLCRDLQIDGELTTPAVRTAYVWADDALRPLPDAHVLGVPTDLDALSRSGLVSAEGVARAAQDLDRPADPSDPGVTGLDVALGPYLRRRLGDEVVDRLIDPLIGGINAGDTSRLSLAAVAPQLDAAARNADPSVIRACRAQRAAAEVPPSAPVFAAPLGGMARLVEELVAAMPGLDVRIGRRAVEFDPGSVAHARATSRSMTERGSPSTGWSWPRRRLPRPISSGRSPPTRRACWTASTTPPWPW